MYLMYPLSPNPRLPIAAPTPGTAKDWVREVYNWWIASRYRRDMHASNREPGWFIEALARQLARQRGQYATPGEFAEVVLAVMEQILAWDFTLPGEGGIHDFPRLVMQECDDWELYGQPTVGGCDAS